MWTRMALGFVCSLTLMLQSSQDYPTKPVRIIEPFGAGGGPDVISRAVSPKLSALWGQPVTVENHPGAGSTAAPALVAKSPPDGYTLLVNTSAHAYSAAVLKNLPYNPLKDFIPVAPLTSQPYVLVAGNKATHVPALPGDAIADVIANTVAGHTTYMMAPIPLALADIRAGKLLALGVTTKKRSSLLPEVPTIAEAGVPGFDYPIWYGVWVPAGTPAGVVDKLAKDIARVLAAPDLRDQLAKHGADPMSMTQPEFARFVLSESESAARIVEAAGIKPR